MRASISAVAAAMFISASATAAFARSNDHLIVPGERIGPVRPGMSSAELYRALGDPKSSERIADQEIYFYQGLQINVRSDSVVLIIANTPGYSTSKGLHPGSSSLALTSLYGDPSSTRSTAGLNFNMWCYPGFSAEVLNTGRVMNIGIGQQTLCR